MLVAMTLAMNGLAIWLRYRLRRNLDGRRAMMSALETHVGERLATKAEARKLSFYYGDFRALKNITMPVHERKVTALIEAFHRHGKSTFLRCFNRMHDLYPGNRYEERDHSPAGQCQPPRARPSIRSRCACGSAWCSRSPIPSRSRCSRTWPTACACAASPRATAYRGKGRAGAAGRGALWEEVKTGCTSRRTTFPAASSSAMCIARALATDPELLLFDEPTSALDPIATASIEELMHDLKERVTILIVTHNMQQAARVSDFTAYMYLGDLIEFGVTDELFIKPKEGLKRTEDYITGRFG